MPERDVDYCSTLAQNVARLPLLYESGDKSTARLLKDAGLPGAQPSLSVDQVENALRGHGDLIGLWLKRGTDQRVTGGWGIEPDGKNFRLVDYGTGLAVPYTDPAKATAEFLVRYVGFICGKFPPDGRTAESPVLDCPARIA